MKHLLSVNIKARRIEGVIEATVRTARGNDEVVALQDQPTGPPQQEGPHIPLAARGESP